MELAIPLIALGGLYIVSKQNRDEESEEGFVGYQDLPNTNIPNKNYPTEYPIETPEYSRTEQLTNNNKYQGDAYTDKYITQLSKQSQLEGTGNLVDSSKISLDNGQSSSVGIIERENLQNQGLEFTSLT